MDRKYACIMSVLLIAGMVFTNARYSAVPASPSALPPSTPEADPLILSINSLDHQANSQFVIRNSGLIGIQNKPTAEPAYAGVTARNYHTCALAASGNIQCWGDNRFGQLGVGDNLSRSNPVDVVLSGLTGQVNQVAAGGYHTCALTTTGEVWCWGQNALGQLGDGTTIDKNSPVKVIPAPGSNKVILLSAGGYHTCVLHMLGTLECWGGNNYGQLGDGTLTNHPVPTPVSGLGGVVSEAETGWFHTCAALSNKTVKCWGLNDYGQLGNGSQKGSSMPVKVTGLPPETFFSLAAGRYHTCALAASGSLWCWGGNNFGQLGDGSTSMRLSAVPVTALASSVLDIGAGFVHTCARLATGFSCWGSNEFGQLGDATRISHSLPAPVTSLPAGAIGLASGGTHTCALLPGSLLCWGWDNYGQLGDGSPSSRVLPAPVSGLAGSVTAVSAGAAHTCAVALGSQAWCWGENSSGQLGDGTTLHRGTPVPVQSLPGIVTRLGSGEAHTCALLGSGSVWCWGANNDGQLGSGSLAMNSLLPTPVSGLSSGVVDLATQANHTCALSNPGGIITCWGLNKSGQLGDGTQVNRFLPITVTGPAGGYIALAVGAYHTCAVTSSETVLCWGDNTYGQLGDGGTSPHLTPTTVPALTGVIALAAGAYHTCALTSTLQVECWGLNLNGQLGIGDNVERPSPTPVPGLTGVTGLTANAYHTCALLSFPPDAGRVKCWGQNNTFQLGTGITGDQSSPVVVAGLAQGILAISAGPSHTCALVGPGEPLGPGALVCWGWTGYGQLGALPIPWRAAPAAVTDQQVFPTGFTQFCLENNPSVFTLIDFSSHFSAASGRGLQTIRIDSLPDAGKLLFSNHPVTSGQEIGYTQINDLSYQPAAGWTGTTSFTWNGSDGIIFSPIAVPVTLTVTGDPIYLPVVRE